MDGDGGGGGGDGGGDAAEVEVHVPPSPADGEWVVQLDGRPIGALEVVERPGNEPTPLPAERRRLGVPEDGPAAEGDA